MRAPRRRPIFRIQGFESRRPEVGGETPSHFGKRLILVALFIVLAIILIDPELPPEREVFAARASLNAAKDIQADIYAPKAWDKAKKAFDVASLEIEAQSGKHIFLRRYDRAKRLFSGAQDAAERALHAAEAGREEFRRRATTKIQAITDTLSQADVIASDLEKCTRVPPFPRAEVETLRDVWETLMNEAANVMEAIASGNYAAALSLAEPVSEESSRLLDELQETKARSRC